MPPSDSWSDAQLLAATSSDRDAFAIFYRRYADNVFPFFINRTRSRDLAADLTAETFAAALTAARRYKASAPNAGPWLFKIAHHKLRDSYRRGVVESRARRQLGMQPIELVDDELAQVVARIDFADHERWLETELAELPAAQRQAGRAHVVEEQSYAEIAERLRCSESVVRQRVSRGLTSLRARASEES